MIVKNEEDVLARCLDSIKNLVDEIIIVDTGSTDSTRKIASQYTDRVYDYPWSDDFAAARNFSFSKATMEYCMWLDADDILLPCDQIAFRALKSELTPVPDVIMMKYNTSFDEAGNPTFSYYRERIVRNSGAYRWQGAVHEVITPNGTVIHSEIAISHKKLHPSDPDRNLRIFEKQIAEGRLLDPRQQYYYARELYYHGRDENACQIIERFLDEGRGWIENNIEACQLLSWCYYRRGEDQLALRALLRSLEYDSPRAEICCDLGKHFFDRNHFKEAVFWYQTALGCDKNERSGGFISEDCYDYLPHIQLCVCYDKLGDRKLSVYHNEAAGKIKPDSRAYLYNKEYFSHQ